MDIEQLLSQLEEGSNRERRAASYKLGKLKDASTVPHLIRACNDGDPSVRRNAVTALREIGTKEALDYLKSDYLKSSPELAPVSIPMDGADCVKTRDRGILIRKRISSNRLLLAVFG